MNKCVKCDDPIAWGDFAYNENICWDCFRVEVEFMIGQIKLYNSHYWHKREEHRAILKWMAAIIAEVYGLEW